MVESRHEYSARRRSTKCRYNEDRRSRVRPCLPQITIWREDSRPRPMRIKNHRMPDAKRRAADACVRTASSRVGQSPDPPHYRSRKAHLQHPQEDRCNWSCDNNQDSPRSGICDQLTRPRLERPRARLLARGRLEVVLVLSMLFSKSPISPAPVRANLREYTKTAYAPQCDLHATTVRFQMQLWSGRKPSLLTRCTTVVRGNVCPPRQAKRNRNRHGKPQIPREPGFNHPINVPRRMESHPDCAGGNGDT